MAYHTLRECVEDLHASGMLKIIDAEVDPCLQLGMIQRRAFQKRSPALLFTNVKNCAFPMLANLFGTMERMEFLFRDTLSQVRRLFELVADPMNALKKPLSNLELISHANHLRPLRKKIRNPEELPLLSNNTKLDSLPRLISWPQDGGPFITLPLVYTEDPERKGAGNLGMYRIQLAGNDYDADEVGLHYQIHRGIAAHHAKALQKDRSLPVNIYIGGPPALIVSAIMPLPANMNELMFAGLLGGCRVEVDECGFALPVLGACDFLLQGEIGRETKKEGPFGDHVGYYSLRHDFPVAKVRHVWHRKDAIWPFTTVGRPPQEDTVFGNFIHELTAPLINKVFEGIKEIHAVDASGVHPLLLAIGKERYTPWEQCRIPRELLTLAFHLLGTTQTALAKYLLMVAESDSPHLSSRDVREFFKVILEKTDFSRDLHFITRSTSDTLDYCGGRINEGSRLIWTAAGKSKRKLGTELHGLPDLPEGFSSPHLCLPGVLILQGPQHTLDANMQDIRISDCLCPALASWQAREHFPLCVIADDSDFCAAKLENFLWISFTRSDPATDTYGVNAKTNAKHWQCETPFIIDARIKKFHAPALLEEPSMIKEVENLATANGPLAGII